ncbi:ABC transporter permease [Parashewanella tropica]|uniref:ABC transporter permease n=1 Tax=Parashewanella tropica TaxID=2547970 RepID=UPI00105989BF|nr:ABC transporter permease [Parashewanella tropica]
MLNNYILAALRAFNRQKKHTLLNLFGLSVGLAAAILVALFVNFERSFDKSPKHSEHIYRVAQYFIPIGTSAPITSPVLDKHIDGINGIRDVFSLDMLNGYIDDQVKVGDRFYQLNDLMSASPNIDEYMNITVLKGDLTKALTQPDQIALVRSEAMRLFGSVDVVGKTLARKEGRWTVAAVFDELPANTHFAFNSLAYRNPAFFEKMRLSHNGGYNYLRLDPNTNPESVATQLQSLFNKVAYGGQNVVEVRMQPFSQIHLTSDSRFELKQGGSETTVLVCIGLSLLLIVIASVNFINMSVAQASQRAKEVGVRKALGASRSQLVAQFLCESTLLAIISAVIACALVELSLPWFNTLVDRQLSLNYLSSFSVFIVGITLLVGLVAGLYPALFISSFSAKRVLSGDLQRGKTAIWVRKSLLVLQSAMSIALIIGSITLYQQLTLINSLPVGYEREHKLLVAGLPRNQLFFHYNSSFMDEISRLPGVNSVSAFDSDLTAVIGSSTSVIWQGGNPEGEVVPFAGTSFDIVKTHGLNLIAGRDFSKQQASDWYQKHDDGSKTAGIIVTRALAEQAGFNDPQQAIGQVWRFNDNTKGKIVGVIENLKVGSVKESLVPAMLVCGLSFQNVARMVVDFEPAQLMSVKQGIKDIIQRQFNMAVPKMELLSVNYDAIYKSDRQVSEVVTIFSILAIVLTCVGILGLASFSALRRGKEVAIRKVLGDSVFGLVNLLAKEFMILVLISVLIAFPLTYLLVDDWLSNFNERVSQSILAYGFAVLVVTSVTWITVASIAYKVASARPSMMLRYE